MKLSEKLKQIRTQKKMTQEQLSKALHVTRQAVSNWERGISEPDIETLRKISEIFSCKLSDLMEDSAPAVIHWRKIIVLTLLSAASIIFLLFIKPSSFIYHQKENFQVVLYHFLLIPAAAFLIGCTVSSWVEHWIQFTPRKLNYSILPLSLLYLCCSLFLLFFPEILPVRLKAHMGTAINFYPVLFLFQGFLLNLSYRK